MNSVSRISSIRNTSCLDQEVTGFTAFSLSYLNLPSVPEVPISTDLRLGHLVEKVVSGLIRLSENYQLLHENLQVIEDGITIGELDFILKNTSSNQLIHMELAYKFYVFDPSISSNVMHCWIGPNRKDSLHEKLEKLEQKQFPLLHHPQVHSILAPYHADNIQQSLCMLANLFVPYQFKETLDPAYQKAIKGYYVDFNTFVDLDQPSKSYYSPDKKEWGIEPSDHDSWSAFASISELIQTSLKEKQSVLCWQKEGEVFSQFFIVWW